jgi:kynurenine 3-monooxygenase
MTEPAQFTIVGAGLAGALMATYLGQAGYEVELHEKRPDPRRGDVDAGRSINLALSTRGLQALSDVGLADAVLKHAVPMRGRLMHAVDGTLTYQPYGTAADHVINSVSRAGLNMQLLDAAEATGRVRTIFESVCRDVDFKSRTAVMDSGNDRKTVPYQVLIGSDGAFSKVRNRLQRLDRFDYSQTYLSHGYKELVIPPAADGGFRIDTHMLHIWPRGGFMMIALPNADGSFTCTLFWPLDGPAAFSKLQTSNHIQDYFNEVFGDAVPHMPTLVEDYLANPVSSLVTVRCSPWHDGDRVVLIGDAAHAIVPFYGQGMNASFEDCRALHAKITAHAPDWPQAFEAYFEERKPNGDSIADLAIQNFYEMRDHVGSRWFLFKKRVGRLLHRLYPGYLPIYSMVTFSTIPYAEAAARAELQQRVLRRSAVAGFVVILTVVLWLLAIPWSGG